MAQAIGLAYPARLVDVSANGKADHSGLEQVESWQAVSDTMAD